MPQVTKFGTMESTDQMNIANAVFAEGIDTENILLVTYIHKFQEREQLA